MKKGRKVHKRLLALSASVFGPTGVSRVLRRLVQHKKTLRHNIEIRKLAAEIRLANDVADLRRILTESCGPIFDHIDIILSRSSDECGDPKDRWIDLLRLDLMTSAGKQIGHVELGRSAAKRGALCVDVQLLARELQPALSAAVERMTQSTSSPIWRPETKYAEAAGLPSETNRYFQSVAPKPFVMLHVVGNWVDLCRLERLLYSFNAIAPGVQHRVVFAGKDPVQQMQSQFQNDMGIYDSSIFVCTAADADPGGAAEFVRGLEPVMLKQRPSWIIVYGNSNASIAAALVAARLSIRIAHIEAGWRSTTCNTEKANGVLIDQLSECLFTSCVSVQQQLVREGISPEKIQVVGGDWNASNAAHQIARVLVFDDAALGPLLLVPPTDKNPSEKQSLAF